MMHALIHCYFVITFIQMFTKAELIGALCTILAFLSAAQILLTGILSFAFPHFLSLSHCSMATAAGVISGLVAVPMIIQLKTAQMYAKN